MVLNVAFLLFLFVFYSISWLCYYVFLFNILLGFIVNVIAAFKTSFCYFREKQFDTGHFLKSTVQYNLKLCMWKVAEAACFLIGHPQYVSSQPVPTWTRSSEYTCGASWRVWDTKPQRKAIATTGQYRNTSIIATLRSGQKVLQEHLSEDEAISRAKLVLIWVWYPWL